MINTNALATAPLAPSVSASLDPYETSISPTGLIGSGSQRRLHQSHWRIRSQIITALATAEDDYLGKRATRLDLCCHSPILRKDSHGKATIDLQPCRDRLCPLCQRQRGRKATLKIAHEVKGWNSCRFATFTLRHADEPLTASLQRLAVHFRTLRSSPLWKSNVSRGVWSIEVTRNQETHRWHTHIHCLIDGHFIDQKVLASLWHTITGDSKIVDIRAVHDRERTAKYIADYVSKPADVHGWSDDDICEYAIALHGKRLIHTFGKAHGANIDPKIEEVPKIQSDYVAPAAIIIKAARLGCGNACHAASILRRISRTHAFASDQDFSPNVYQLPPVEIWEHAIVIATASRLFSLQCSGLPLFSPQHTTEKPRETQPTFFRETHAGHLAIAVPASEIPY